MKIESAVEGRRKKDGEAKRERDVYIQNRRNKE